MTISNELNQLHEDLIEFGSKVQSISARTFEKKQHIESNVHAVFYKVSAYAITLHRAILSLCEDGWSHIAPILLRTIMECSSNCLAIVNNELPEYMAFKYLYYDYIKIYRDNRSSENLKQKNLHDIEKGLEHIQSSSAKEKAREFFNEGRQGIYWFKPEENNISSIIRNYGSEGFKDLYEVLSWSVHATYFGLFQYKDNPDDTDIKPFENPIKTKLATAYSCLLLLEFLRIRYEYEGLGFDSDYDELFKRIFVFAKEARNQIAETL